MSQADRPGSADRTQQAGGAGAHRLPFLQPGFGRTVRLDWQDLPLHSHRTGRSLKVHWKRMCRVPSCLRLPRGPIPPWASQLPLTPHTLHYLCNSYSNAKAIIHGRTVPSTKVCLSAPAPGAIPSGFIIQIKEVLHAFFVCLFFW